MRRITNTNKKEPILRSIDNALALLQYLGTKQDGARLSTISSDLEINIASIHRILITLKKRGFVERDIETKRYRLGPTVKRIGNNGGREMDFYNRSLVCLNEICQETSETANLAIRDNWEAVYALQIQSPHALRVANRVGSRVPLHCTASGKALLAFLDNELLQKYFADVELKPFTRNTITSRRHLEEELKAIVQTGIAYDREEQALGETCLATPIIKEHGEIYAAISISMPTTRLSKKISTQYAQILLDKGAKLSGDLGFNIDERRRKK